MFPSTANLVCHKAGLKNAWGFDLLAACSGFLYALTTGAAFIESGRYKKVIVAGGDKMSSIVDYSDRTTCIIFGDGACGCIAGSKYRRLWCTGQHSEKRWCRLPAPAYESWRLTTPGLLEKLLPTKNISFSRKDSPCLRRR